MVSFISRSTPPYHVFRAVKVIPASLSRQAAISPGQLPSRARGGPAGHAQPHRQGEPGRGPVHVDEGDGGGARARGLVRRARLRRQRRHSLLRGATRRRRDLPRDGRERRGRGADQDRGQSVLPAKVSQVEIEIEIERRRGSHLRVFTAILAVPCSVSSPSPLPSLRSRATIPTTSAQAPPNFIPVFPSSATVASHSSDSSLTAGNSETWVTRWAHVCPQD